MKNLKIIAACLISGEHTEAGSLLENVNNALAADLVSSGRAVVVAAEYEVLGHPDPAPQNRDLKVTGKRVKGG